MKQKVFLDVPLFEIKSFQLYELNQKGLETYMVGKEATRYTNRYEVLNIDYTDNSKEYIANMRSDFGLYKGNTVDLDGNVIYTRTDGFTFESQHVMYNKKTSIAVSDNEYISHIGQNKIIGSFVKYNNNKNILDSKDITATYILNEGKK
jgi:hypothetical protein